MAGQCQTDGSASPVKPRVRQGRSLHMSVANIPIESPRLTSTTTRFRWQEQTLAMFYRNEGHIGVCMAANKKWNDTDDIRMVQPVDPTLIDWKAPRERRVELDVDYSVRWIMQKVDTEFDRTSLTLESLEADYSGDQPVLCESRSPSLECVYHFNRPFRSEPSVSSDFRMSPALCFTGFAKDGDFWVFEANTHVTSREAFALRFICPYDTDGLPFFTYALFQDQLVPCEGNGFERMIYAVLTPGDRPIESSIQVNMGGMLI